MRQSGEQAVSEQGALTHGEDGVAIAKSCRGRILRRKRFMKEAQVGARYEIGPVGGVLSNALPVIDHGYAGPMRKGRCGHFKNPVENQGTAAISTTPIASAPR